MRSPRRVRIDHNAPRSPRDANSQIASSTDVFPQLFVPTSRFTLPSPLISNRSNPRKFSTLIPRSTARSPQNTLFSPFNAATRYASAIVG
jgi:hypothetical protein